MLFDVSREKDISLLFFHPNQVPTGTFNRSLHAIRQRQKEAFEGKKKSAARTPSTPFLILCSLRN
jgi:hypothetical protein